jgi:cytidine deaminase
VPEPPAQEPPEALIDAARRAREHAYAPYSRFRVGAALETEEGAVFTGANVENASYGATLCAERAAVACMVAAGGRKIRKIVVYAEGPELTMPCGMCRQVLSEFGIDAQVIVVGPAGRRSTVLSALLPEPFVFEVPR